MLRDIPVLKAPSAFSGDYAISVYLHNMVSCNMHMFECSGDPLLIPESSYWRDTSHSNCLVGVFSDSSEELYDVVSVELHNLYSAKLFRDFHRELSHVSDGLDSLLK